MPAPTLPPALPSAPVTGPGPLGAPATTTSGTRVMELTTAQVAELLAARDAVRLASLPLLAIGRTDFPLPTLGPMLSRLAGELETDHGHVVVRGLPVDRLSDADHRLLLWGIGRHVGIPVSQDYLGRLIRPADTSRSDFHSGGSDVTALLVRDRGRRVALAHTGRIVDEVALRRPELALRLFGTFALDRMGGYEPGEAPCRWTPIACRHDGRLSMRYDRAALESAGRLDGFAALAPADLTLLDLVDEVAAAPAWRHDVQLEPGDLLLLNNYETLHCHAGHPRHDAAGTREPLRLWLTLRTGRPLPPDFTWATPAYGETGGRGGINPRDVIEPREGIDPPRRRCSTHRTLSR